MARFFNGTTDLINCGSVANSIFTENGAITCGAWIFPISVGEASIGAIITRNSIVQKFGVAATNGLRLTINATTDLVRQSTDNSIVLNVWQFVVMTWDGVITTAASARFFVNGVETGYSVTTNGATATDNATMGLFIGNNTSAVSTFNGAIAELQIFNRVLSIGEIRGIQYLPGSIRNGLMGYWPLLGYSSPEPDLSGNKFNGTLTGTTRFPDPPIGRFLRQRRKPIQVKFSTPIALSEGGSLGSRIFNGTSDVINCSNLSAINSFTKYSACAWIKIRTMSGTGTICAKRDGTSKGWQMYVDGANSRLGFFAGFTGIDEEGFTPNASLSVGVWTHVAVCYDTTDLLSAPSMYINGARQTVTETLPTLLLDDDVAANFTIGAFNSSNFLNASIARVSYFDRVLTQGEVIQEMRCHGSVSNPKLSLSINGTSSPEPDTSGNKNNGTVTGASAYSGPPIGRYNRQVRNRFARNFPITAAAYTTDLILSMALSDSISKNDLKALLESISLSESKSFNDLKTLLESITLSESKSSDTLKTFTDSLSLSESKAIDLLKFINLVEAISLAESKSVDYLKVVTQNLTVSEAQTFDILKPFADSMTLTESQVRELTKILSLNIGVTESQVKDILLVFAESLAVSEQRAFDFLKIIADTIQFAESHRLHSDTILMTLLSFSKRGLIDAHDKVSMMLDLVNTAMSKQDIDSASSDLVGTGTLSQDLHSMKSDTEIVDEF